MVQGLRIYLPTWGTQVRSLVREGPTCWGATKPLLYNYGAQGLQQKRPRQRESCAPPLEHSPCSPQLKKTHSKQQRPSAAKNFYFFKKRETISTSHSGTYCSVAQSCPTLCNPGTTAHQVSLSFTISRSLLKLMSIESMMSCNHLTLSV